MTSQPPSPVRAPPHILALLDRLHNLSSTQEAALGDYLASNQRTPDAPKVDFDDLMRDKFIALDKDKCEFIYQLIRAKGATRVVEAGTSFGVSTIYLALAVGQNSADGRVIATEKESSKAERAREHWRECGREVEGHVELKEGDLLETLKDVGEVDILLLDSTSTAHEMCRSVADCDFSMGAIGFADFEVGPTEDETWGCGNHGQQRFFCGQVQRSLGLSEKTGEPVHESHSPLLEWVGDECACWDESTGLNRALSNEL